MNSPVQEDQDDAENLTLEEPPEESPIRLSTDDYEIVSPLIQNSNILSQ
jgi:hypothetical protein